MLVYSNGSLAGGNPIPNTKAALVSSNKVANWSQDGCPLTKRLEKECISDCES
jgi:hypothetical protein